ncbi:MAG: amidase family protein [Gemmatimonadaceae bacterium]
MEAASEVAARVRSGALSPVAVVEEALARIAHRNPELNAIVTQNPHALDDARALEKRIARGEDVGLLAGVPVGIKDVTPVAGLRTTYGSPIYKDHVPTADALIVERLRNAGAIIIGKTNTPEFAAGGNTWNDVFGRTRNPWDPSKSAGGSTGGGAVGLATGMIALAEGTDLGGSLRIPASFCGIVGLRPSPGLVPTDPADWMWDTLQVSGPMARTAEDVALMLQAVAGDSGRAPLEQPIGARDFVAAVRAGPTRGLRIGYCPDIAGIGIDASVEAACRQAAFDLRDAGAKVEEIAFDLSYARDAFLALRGEWFVACMQERLDRIDQFGVNVRNNTRAGLEASPRELGAAHHVRGAVWRQFREFFGTYDHLLTPTMCVSPFPVEENYPATVAGRVMKTYVDWLAPTFLLSMAGLPVGSVPCGLDSVGMPVGLQIVGRPRGEESVLALAGAVQAMRPIRLQLSASGF